MDYLVAVNMPGPLLKQSVHSIANSPTTVTLSAGKIAKCWELRRPLFLIVEREENGWYVVSDDLFGAYGDAMSCREALDAYCSTLIEYYEFLTREVQTNSRAQCEYEKIQRYLRPVTV